MGQSSNQAATQYPSSNPLPLNQQPPNAAVAPAPGTIKGGNISGGSAGPFGKEAGNSRGMYVLLGGVILGVVLVHLFAKS